MALGGGVLMISLIRRILVGATLLAVLMGAALPDEPVRSPSARPLERGVTAMHYHAPQEYQAAPQIWAVVQDPRGLLYFGTDGVIVEYDGVSWRQIAVPGATVRALAVDAAGRIWVGGVGELGYLEPDSTGTLQFVSLKAQLPPDQQHAFADVWRVIPTAHGVFFQTFDALLRWDGRQLHVWPTKASFTSLAEVNEQLYTVEIDIGLEMIVGDSLQPAPGGAALAAARKVYLHPYDAGRMLVQQRAKLLSLYDGHTVTPFPTAADGYLLKNPAYTSMLMPDGSVFVTTLTGGVVWIAHDGSLRNVFEGPNSEPFRGVLATWVDPEGALWLGLQEGIAAIELDTPITAFAGKKQTNDVRRYQGSLYAVLGGVGGFVRVESAAAGPSLLHPLSATKQAIGLLEFVDPAPGAVSKLLVAGEGVDELRGDATIPTIPGAGETEAYALVQSHLTPSRLFVGHADGVSSRRWDGRHWIDEGRLPSAEKDLTLSMTETADGTLWAGSSGGVRRIRVAAMGLGASTSTTLTAGFGSGVAAVFQVAGDLYAASTPVTGMLRWDAGAAHFVPDNRFYLPLSTTDGTARLFGLANGDVWSVTRGRKQQRQGLFRRSADGTYRLEEDNFLRLAHIQMESIQLDPDGSLWLAGNDGLYRFDLHAQPARPAFAAWVRRVTSGAEELFGGSVSAHAAPLRLPYNHNALEFAFAAPTYRDPADVRYQYRLDGADRDWSVWTAQTQANSGNLGPGDYRFRVRARTLDGRTSAEGVYAFTVLPPWYRTVWAYAIYIALFLLTATGALRYAGQRGRRKLQLRTEQLEAEARLLERMMRKITAVSSSLAHGANSQASAVEQTAASLEEMAAMTRETAAHASASYELTLANTRLVEETNAAMTRLADAMKAIIAASRKTRNIVAAIEEIGFQTKILALNAAVEAAHAGQVGAGFGVIATEVRSLAERVAEAAKTTTALIDNTVREIGAGDRLAESTHSAFNEVAANIGRVRELITEITRASLEQAQGVAQLNTTVAAINGVTQTNAALGAQLTEALEQFARHDAGE